ncbi:AIR synthase [Ornithobacterium rhinotracheale]|uniref:AIR synthase-related protein n=1 Tax=Ornithobacterium rhinotracheale TaxID=28251 RepID=UPI00129D05B0|nr:AIR synthase-related protein [Ornithobacterium rhinotracheale]MRJ10685.1 AIR synthase [Ornithobacterium rhinotracheale]
MNSGKLNAQGFKELFQSRFGYDSEKIVVKPNFGKDIALIDLGENYMALASDPLSYIPNLGAKKSAELSVFLVANDIATTGVPPQYLQLVLNLNENFTHEAFDAYWQHLHALCEKLKISISGGHTGVVAGQNSTIIGGGTMISVAEKSRFIRCDQAQAGDILLMSKKAAISATAILGLNFPVTAHEVLAKDSGKYFEDLFSQISVMEEGKLAGLFNQKNVAKPIHAMHDVTEGGVLGAVYEMCVANDLGIMLNADAIPVDGEQQLLCQKFLLNPAEIIGAGSMLMAVSPEAVNDLIQYFAQNQLMLTPIGEFTPAENGILSWQGGEMKEIRYSERDAYWEAFFNAVEKGWK